MLSQKIIVDVGINEADNIHYVQGEKGRALEFSFINSLNEDSVVDLTSYNVTIHILKSDGNFTIDSLNIDSENNTAFYTLTENDCIVGGCGVYDLSLSKNGELIYTANGKYTGDFRAVTDDTVNSISTAYGVSFPEGFQEKLIAGDNITIENNVISATGGGSGTSNYNNLNNKPSINGITLSGNKTSSDLGITDTTYTASTGLSLSGNAFSLNSATQNALAEIDNKQDRLTAGDNITIENNVISSTGGDTNSEIITLTAGDGTTSRTFTFSKLPKLIKIYWTIGIGWSSEFVIVWGQDIANYICSVGNVPSTNGSLGCASVTFDTTNKSMTLTGANAFGCANDLTGSGYMFVLY